MYSISATHESVHENLLIYYNILISIKVKLIDFSVVHVFNLSVIIPILFEVKLKCKTVRLIIL